MQSFNRSHLIDILRYCTKFIQIHRWLQDMLDPHPAEHDPGPALCCSPLPIECIERQDATNKEFLALELRPGHWFEIGFVTKVALFHLEILKGSLTFQKKSHY